MVCCAAPKCSKRGDRRQKKRTFRFPKDRNRCKEWVVSINRVGPDGVTLWTPTSGSRLCEDHFSSAQFDSNGFLKRNAVPDKVLGAPVRPSRRTKTRQQAAVQITSTTTMYSITDHSYCKLTVGDHPLEHEVSTHVDSDASKDDTEHSCPEMNAHDPSVEDGSSVHVHSNSPKDSTDLSACETTVHHPCVEDPSSFHDNVDPPEDISEVTVRAFDNVKDSPSQDKDLLIESLKLEVERKERMLAQIFRPDQIEWLESRLTPGSGHDLYKWSSETLSNSLKIRIACGLNGYEYLRKELKYPIPSYRTITRHFGAVKFAPGI
ncbi:hypothetical protein AOXY_G28699 [Acipenser oxyrinchus oxyrinchus]|uniref:THAP domain-containing protein 1 n=1 Tax=Acipenser oxyrinchus oxyrinchus TaxID=40147 RepID=A0AAD8FV12_ACIOX|nr:hypothetical protein AOXY_G28699 [Acipenser oxyrinchus oxyrinchus]